MIASFTFLFNNFDITPIFKFSLSSLKSETKALQLLFLIPASSKIVGVEASDNKTGTWGVKFSKIISFTFCSSDSITTVLISYSKALFIIADVIELYPKTMINFCLRFLTLLLNFALLISFKNNLS